MQVPMLDLKREYQFMKAEIDDAMRKCLSHQKWILGPEVAEFENEVSRYLDVGHCIGTSSGTEALVLPLRALAIQLKGQEYFDKSDRVITTAFTFTATGDAILRAGATPVFVDIDPETYNIDPAAIEDYLRRFSEAPGQESKVVGIVAVHLYGRPCDMDSIMRIARQHNLFVLEDTAQAFGGSWGKRKLGSLGTCGAFSFFPSKNLGAFGDAGMVCTNDGELAEIVRMLLKHGGKDKYNVDHVGYNGRLDTIQAAILLVKLGFLDNLNQQRRIVAQTYTAGLSHLEGIALPVNNPLDKTAGTADRQESLPPGHVFHQYTLRLSPAKRDLLQDVLHKKGISTMVYYPFPLHKMRVFAGGRSIAGNLPHAASASLSVLSLPMGPFQTGPETEYVLEQVRSFFIGEIKTPSLPGLSLTSG